MKISVSWVLIHLMIFGVPFLFFGWFYKNVLHPNYRWQQQGNRCYEDKACYATYMAVIVFAAFELTIHNHVITFSF
jgi:hypothetical protein